MRLLMSVFISLLSVQVAFAQGEIPQAKSVIEFTPDALSALAQDAGWNPRSFQNDDGTQGVAATISGRELVMIPTACDQRGTCKGLYTYALIPDDPEVIDLNSFNLAFNPARATTQDGILVLDNYLVGDYGVVRGSLAVHLKVQADLITAWWEFRQNMTSPGHSSTAQTVSFQPFTPLPSPTAWQERLPFKPAHVHDVDRFKMLQANGL